MGFISPGRLTRSSIFRARRRPHRCSGHRKAASGPICCWITRGHLSARTSFTWFQRPYADAVDLQRKPPRVDRRSQRRVVHVRRIAVHHFREPSNAVLPTPRAFFAPLKQVRVVEHGVALVFDVRGVLCVRRLSEQSVDARISSGIVFARVRTARKNACARSRPESNSSCSTAQPTLPPCKSICGGVCSVFVVRQVSNRA